MHRWQAWISTLFMLWLPGAAAAAVDYAEFLPCGVEGGYVESGSTHNVVLHVTITASSPDTLTELTIDNYNGGAWPFADRNTDIVDGSVRIWYAAVDTGRLNTATAVSVGSMNYVIGMGYPSWKITGLSQPVADGSGIYVTVDILPSPTVGASLAFTVDQSNLVFGSGPYSMLNPFEPMPPPNLYISEHHPAARIEVGHHVTGPTTVSTGQTFSPFTFSIHNPNVDYPASNAPVAVSGITLTVKDQAGNPLPPNLAVEKIDLLVQDWKNNLWLFSVPATAMPVTPGPIFVPMSVAVDADNDPTRSLSIEVRVTVNSNTANAVSKFRMELGQPAHVAASDALSGRPVAVAPAGGHAFAMQSSLISVQLAARQVLARHHLVMAANDVVIKGQTNVNPMDLIFTNPGNTCTARIDITQITLEVTDAAGTTIAPSSVFSRVAISGGVLYGETTAIPSNGYLVTVPLSSSNISVLYQPVTVSVMVDILPEASAVSFRLSLAGPAAVRAQDANSQLQCTVIPETASDLFPMRSNAIRVASSFLVTGVSLAPATLYPNQRTAILQLTFSHPGPANLGDIVLRGLTVTALNQASQPVQISGDIVNIFARDSLGVEQAHAAVPAVGSTAYLALPNIAVQPFTTLTLRLEIQLTDAPRDATLRLGVISNAAIDATLPLDPTRPVFVAGAWPILSQAAACGGGEGRLRLSNYPNPFPAGRASTRIAYYLDQSCNVSAVLYTLAGDEVLALARGDFQLPGEHLLEWNGRTASGGVVVNGVYLLRLEAVPTAAGDPIVQLRKIAVVK